MSQTSILPALGQRIRATREERNISQGTLALRMGCTQTAVSYWESGKRTISVEDLALLARTLGVAVEALLPQTDDAEPVPSPPSDDEQIIAAAIEGDMGRWVGPWVREDVARAVIQAITAAGWTIHQGEPPAPPDPTDPVEARVRKTIAASLRRAAAGRREYAKNCPPGDENHTLLTTSADCYESTARIVEDPSVVMDVIPSWRWTDEETASLYQPSAQG